MLVEYPGYGRSEGKPSLGSITETVIAAYDTLTARADVDARRIFAYGRSLGGGAACALADARPIAALLLQSTFTSTRSLAKRFLVPPLLVMDPFDNLSTVRSYSGPVLVAHGENDDQIPYDHGLQLAAAAQNGTFLSYDCVHDDCPPDWSAFWATVGRFLAENGLVPGP